jgi:hypothetical protein
MPRRRQQRKKDVDSPPKEKFLLEKDLDFAKRLNFSFQEKLPKVGVNHKIIENPIIETIKDRIQKVANYVEKLDWKTSRRYDWEYDTLTGLIGKQIGLKSVNCCCSCQFLKQEGDGEYDYDFLECDTFKISVAPENWCWYFTKRVKKT